MAPIREVGLVVCIGVGHRRSLVAAMSGRYAGRTVSGRLANARNVLL